jgi:Flp pilus assembly protein TadG
MPVVNVRAALSRRAARRPGERRGAAAVEFAVVSPLLVMLLLGVIEFGRMSMVQQAITTAAREGAREAIVDGSTESQVRSTVNSYLAAGGIRGATVTLTPDLGGTVHHGEAVSVSVSIPFAQVSWLPAPHFLGGRTLSSTSIMRRESPQ